MPTIKDIAAKAGVAHSTVSNVLNKKGNVSAEKIQLIERIASEMGYKMNTQAQQLRAGKTRIVCVIVPGISMKKYGDLYRGIELCLKPHNIFIELFCTDDEEQKERDALQKALSLSPMAIVIVSCQTKNRGSFPEDVRCYCVERRVRGVRENVSYVSFDFDRAGRDMALRCIKDGHRSTAILVENGSYSNNRTFLDGAADIMEDNNCIYKIFRSDDNMWLNRAFEILDDENNFDAVIAMSYEAAEYIRRACQYRPGVSAPTLYALAGKSVGIDREIFRYELNYKLLGKRIAEQIVSGGADEGKQIAGRAFAGGGDEKEMPSGWADGNSTWTRKSDSLHMENDGFLPSPAVVLPSDRTLCFLTVSNPTSRAIKMLLPAFAGETGIRVNIVEAVYDENHRMLQDNADGNSYDLIRLDMAWMTELGKDMLRPLDEDSPDICWLKDQMLSTLSPDYSSVGGILYALPLDACTQMLFYRKDLFDDELIRRKFYETCKRKLEIPKTFQEYDEIAHFFSERVIPQSDVKFGATAAYGRSFLAADGFLPRYRETGGVIFAENGRVCIQTPEMEQTLRQYLDACQYTSGRMYQWWHEATEEFASGTTAMHMVFSNYASEIVHSASSKVIGKVGFGIVPGGKPLSGGGSIGISKYSEKYDDCMAFLKWLYRRDVAEMITYLGGYICNKDISNNLDILEMYPWLNKMEESFRLAWRNSSCRERPHFPQFQFEDILGKAIQSAALRIEQPAVALKKAQMECDRRFNS